MFGTVRSGLRCPRSGGLACPGPFGGRRQHLVLHLGPCPRVARPRVAPLQRAPPARRVGGNSDGVQESQEQDPPRALPRPLVARKTWRRGAGPAPLRRTGSSLGMLGAGRSPSALEEESPGGAGDAPAETRGTLSPRFVPDASWRVWGAFFFFSKA